MTIRSMPTNQNWYDNYDKIFGKKEEPKVLDLPPMYFFKVSGEWYSAVCGHVFNPPLLTNIYQVDQVHYKDMLMYELRIVANPQSPLDADCDLFELHEALMFCSNYGGAWHYEEVNQDAENNDE